MYTKNLKLPKYDRNSRHYELEERLEVKDICTSDRAVFLKECELKDIEDLKQLFEKYNFKKS